MAKLIHSTAAATLLLLLVFACLSTPLVAMKLGSPRFCNKLSETIEGVCNDDHVSCREACLKEDGRAVGGICDQQAFIDSEKYNKCLNGRSSFSEHCSAHAQKMLSTKRCICAYICGADHAFGG